MSLTPCPDLDRLVDDAAAGLPGAADRLDAHAMTCAACLAEADALDDGFGDALACLRDETCPPEVLAAVFAEVDAPARTRLTPHRAADRPARPTASPARRRVWSGVLAAVALVAVATFWPRPEAPLVAQRTPAEVRETPAPDAILPAGPPAIAEPTVSTPAIAEPPAAPRPARSAPRRATRRSAVSPRAAAPVPAERLDPPDTPDLAETPTLADTVSARQDLLLALRIVGRAQRQADAAVQTEMQRVTTALEPAQLLQ